MIKAIIIVNNYGNPRIIKFYQSVQSEEIQQSIIRRIYQQVAARPDSFCNYLEDTTIIPEWNTSSISSSSNNTSNDSNTNTSNSIVITTNTIKLIYRHYATLYFVFAVDEQESDLGILDLIQVIVEALDKCFENVCELDLIFHSDRVHYILDEIIMGGMVLETNIHTILQSISDQDKLSADSLLVSTTTGTTNSNQSIQQRIQYNW